MKKNTSKLWDGLWDKETSKKEDILTLAKEEKGIRWTRLEQKVLKEFGTFQNLKVIEIGAGAGTNAALMAKRGANTTVLDYSEKAIRRARLFFKRNNLTAKFELQDVLSIPEVFLEKYDISMSFGLAEHFVGNYRIPIIKAHFDVLRGDGITFISVPNKYNLPYRIWKFRREVFKKWHFGLEEPYSRSDFRKICKSLNVKEYTYLGDSFITSLNFINPLKNLIQFVKKMRYKKNNFDVTHIRREKGTFCDEYVSYALVLCAKKP